MSLNAANALQSQLHAKQKRLSVVCPCTIKRPKLWKKWNKKSKLNSNEQVQFF